MRFRHKTAWTNWALVSVASSFVAIAAAVAMEVFIQLTTWGVSHNDSITDWVALPILFAVNALGFVSLAFVMVFPFIVAFPFAALMVSTMIGAERISGRGYHWVSWAVGGGAIGVLALILRELQSMWIWYSMNALSPPPILFGAVVAAIIARKLWHRLALRDFGLASGSTPEPQLD